MPFCKPAVTSPVARRRLLLLRLAFSPFAACLARVRTRISHHAHLPPRHTTTPRTRTHARTHLAAPPRTPPNRAHVRSRADIHGTQRDLLCAGRRANYIQLLHTLPHTHRGAFISGCHQLRRRLLRRTPIAVPVHLCSDLVVFITPFASYLPFAWRTLRPSVHLAPGRHTCLWFHLYKTLRAGPRANLHTLPRNTAPVPPAPPRSCRLSRRWRLSHGCSCGAPRWNINSRHCVWVLLPGTNYLVFRPSGRALRSSR